MPYFDHYSLTVKDIIDEASKVLSTGDSSLSAKIENKNSDVVNGTNIRVESDNTKEIKTLKDSVVKYGKQSDKYLAVAMVILEGYLDEDITDEDEIVRALLHRIDEISKTSMCSKMKQRIIDYRNRLEDTDE